MKGLATLCVVCVFLLFSPNINGQELTHKGDFVLGAQLGLGLEWGARNKALRDDMDRGFSFGGGAVGFSGGKNSAGFSAGGWVYADYYLLDLLALEGGLGFVGKGGHFKYEIDALVTTVQGDHWIKMAYMEIPLGVKLNIHNFRISTLILLNIALTGKFKSDVDGNTDEDKFDDDYWDFWRRFNLGLRLQAGYAIPIGPIVLIPGIDWSTHFVDEIKDDDVEDYQVRWMNFFFNVAVEFPIPI
jgi:hypothetical protein